MVQTVFKTLEAEQLPNSRLPAAICSFVFCCLFLWSFSHFLRSIDRIHWNALWSSHHNNVLQLPWFAIFQQPRLEFVFAEKRMVWV